MSDARTLLTPIAQARRTYVPYWEANAIELKRMAGPTAALSIASELAEDLMTAREDVFLLICLPTAFILRDSTPGELTLFQRLRLLTLVRLVGKAEAQASAAKTSPSFNAVGWMGTWLFRSHFMLGYIPPSLHLFYTSGGARMVREQLDEDLGHVLANAA